MGWKKSAKISRFIHQISTESFMAEITLGLMNESVHNSLACDGTQNYILSEDRSSMYPRFTVCYPVIYSISRIYAQRSEN
jgi:hypothetical protein